MRITGAKQRKTMYALGLLIAFSAIQAEPQNNRSLAWEFEAINDTVLLWIAACAIEITTDLNNNPHVVNGATYSQYNLKYWYKDNGTWTLVTVDTGGSSMGSITLDSHNEPHIIYRQGNDSYLKYAYHENGQWFYQTIDYCESFCGQKISIKIDANDNPHAAYMEKGGQYRLKYAHKSGGNWDSNFPDGMFSTGSDISMVIDKNNNPHIAHWGTESGVYYERYTNHDGSSWNNSIIDVVSNTNVFSTGLCLDSDNNPHVAYFDHDSPPILKYAYWDGVQWNITKVDTNISYFGGSNVSMVFDKLYCPHIIYGSEFTMMQGNSELRYAHQDLAGNWVIEVVDSIGDAGELNSLAIDSTGRLHAIYYRGPGNSNIGRFIYATSESVLGISDNETILGAQIVALDVYPNPFNDRVEIKFQVANNNNVNLQIYDIAGRLVKQFNHLTSQRFNQIFWDGRDDCGKRVSSGIYFLRLTNGNQTKVEKLLLVK